METFLDIPCYPLGFRLFHSVAKTFQEFFWISFRNYSFTLCTTSILRYKMDKCESKSDTRHDLRYLSLLSLLETSSSGVFLSTCFLCSSWWSIFLSRWSTVWGKSLTDKKQYKTCLLTDLERWTEVILWSGQFNSEPVVNTMWEYVTMGTKPGERLMGQLKRRPDAILVDFNSQSVVWNN